MKKTVTLIASLFILLLELVLIDGCYSCPITYIPVIFGLLYSIIRIDAAILNGPGVKVAFFLMYIRYLVMPPLLLISGYFSLDELCSSMMGKSFLLMIIEMITIFLTLSISKKNKMVENIEVDANNYSYFFPLFLLLIAIVLSIRDPIPLSRYHFILSGAEELFDTDLEEATQGLPRFLNLVHYLLIASVVALFYHFYCKKNNVVFYWLGLAVSVLLSCFYQDTSRNSMLIPLLSILFLNNKVYSKYRRRTNSIVLTITIASMAMLTLIKQFNTVSYTSAEISNSNSSIIMERYFGGATGIYDGFVHEAAISNRIDGETLLTEVFGKVIYLNRIMNQDNRTSVFYNDALGSRSYIIPTISEGYFHFSWLFCWIFTFLIFKIIILLDGFFAKTKRIDIAFVLVSLSVTFGWMHTGNFIICMNSFHMSMILLIIFYFSAILGMIKLK